MVDDTFRLGKAENCEKLHCGLWVLSFMSLARATGCARNTHVIMVWA